MKIRSGVHSSGFSATIDQALTSFWVDSKVPLETRPNSDTAAHVAELARAVTFRTLEQVTTLPIEAIGENSRWGESPEERSYLSSVAKAGGLNASIERVVERGAGSGACNDFLCCG